VPMIMAPPAGIRGNLAASVGQLALRRGVRRQASQLSSFVVGGTPWKEPHALALLFDGYRWSPLIVYSALSGRCGRRRG